MKTIIKIVEGDITRVKAEALITAINSGGLWFGGIDGAIQRAAGNTYHSQVAAQDLSDLMTVVAKGTSEGHQGEFDNVVFVVDDLQSSLNQVVFKGLEAAGNAGFKSVTIPAIRTGVMLGAREKSLKEVADKFHLGVENYLEAHPNTSLREITFVIYNNSGFLELLRKIF